MIEQIKNFYGQIMGSVETKSNGDKIAKDFYGRILGSYIKSSNVTKDFHGRVIAHGDVVVSLIPLKK